MDQGIGVRVTETIKQAISGYTGKLKPSIQSALTQTIAVVSSTIVVAISHADPLNLTHGHTYGWLHYRQGQECILFTGILACGGSAVWNHLLDILKATTEQTADAQIAAAAQIAGTQATPITP